LPRKRTFAYQATFTLNVLSTQLQMQKSYAYMQQTYGQPSTNAATVEEPFARGALSSPGGDHPRRLGTSMRSRELRSFVRGPAGSLRPHGAGRVARQRFCARNVVPHRRALRGRGVSLEVRMNGAIWCLLAWCCGCPGWVAFPLWLAWPGEKR
jgi:hypothetical protein